MLCPCEKKTLLRYIRFEKDTSRKIQSVFKKISTIVFSAPSYKLCLTLAQRRKPSKFLVLATLEKKRVFHANMMLADRLTEWNAAAVRVERYTYITASECCLTTRG